MRGADRIRRLLATIVVGLLAIGVLAFELSATSNAAVPDGSVEDFIDREMPASGVPGMAYAVVAAGQIETGARGVVKRGGTTAVTSDTPFLTGSISKSITALAVMQLVEARRIELDAGVSEYLEGFSGQPIGLISIRQLLCHTSGFSTLQGNASRTDGAGGKDELARIVDQVAQAQVGPDHAPGAQWEYSNLNYQILGRVIEVVSGQDYQSYVESKILEPVGMTHSFVADGEVHDEMATGHRPWFGTKRPLASNKTDRSTAPQGGLVASAGDLALYIQVMLNGEDDILSARGKATMMRPASEVSPHYGFGWFLDTDRASVWHSGSSPGFESLATMIPAERKGVVVLVNAGSGVGFAEATELLRGVTARGVGLDYDGEGSRWSQKMMFVGLAVTPIVFLLSMVWAWRKRDALRAKSGPFGLFSLWFPLLTTLGGAWIIFGLVPVVAGVSIGTLRQFQPDLGLAMTATAVTGVSWAVFRLGVAYTRS